MYLKDSDECEVLLRLIDDCDRLVSQGDITRDAAFNVVSKAARHHSDHPAEKLRREEEYEATAVKHAKKTSAAIEAPIPEPVAPPEF